MPLLTFRRAVQLSAPIHAWNNVSVVVVVRDRKHIVFKVSTSPLPSQQHQLSGNVAQRAPAVRAYHDVVTIQSKQRME